MCDSYRKHVQRKWEVVTRNKMQLLLGDEPLGAGRKLNVRKEAGVTTSVEN